MTSLALPKDKDIAHWLETKTQSSSSSSAAASGDALGVWGCRQITPLLSTELLAEIQSCFVDLQTPVKLKLLLSMLHLTRRSLDQVHDLFYICLFHMRIQQLDRM